MSEVIVSCHQPNFMPYLGFFDKMKKSDIFVIRDEVLFTDSDYHHRNRIRINGHDNYNDPQFKWITIPVNKINDHIMHVSIKKDAKIKNKPWKQSILHDIESNYRNTPLFSRLFPSIKQIFEEDDDESLISINMKIIHLIKELFGINTKIMFASELGLKSEHYEKTDASVDLANICKQLNADVYLSGSGGRNYLNLDKFDEYGIEVRFHDFSHPLYRQNYPGFLPNMSAIDYLFCTGNLAIENKMILTHGTYN
ncbi:WbqC-like protein family protein [uncultured archaeon]|nr:WbqC-like protein family protein [uncultured archaeon]